jgi:hypothetical protein
MYLRDTLIACPACSRHARPSEIACPHCGARFRNDDGSRTRTAGAALLGLLVAGSAGAAGCWQASTDYGVAATGSWTAASSGAGGAGGATGCASASSGSTGGGAGGTGGAPASSSNGTGGAHDGG